MSADIDNDPLLRRAVDELRRLPPVEPDAVRRVVAAAAAARVSPGDEPALVVARGWRSARLWSGIGIAAAAAVAGFALRGTLTSRGTEPSPAAVVAPPMRDAALPASDVMPIPQQFVLENKTARRISLVGDFNKWNAGSAPMTRSSDGTSWSVIVPILPGRHSYGFMVDDSVFALDPRAPKVRDPDLGTEGSVIIVGRP
jgi:hypothetical protein